MNQNFSEHLCMIDYYSKPLIKFMDEEDNPLITVLDKSGRSYPITRFSSLLSKMNEPIYLFRVYGREDIRHRIEEIIRES